MRSTLGDGAHGAGVSDVGLVAGGLVFAAIGFLIAIVGAIGLAMRESGRPALKRN